jgi:RimJ/RimL family protein N-acetyltransferase
VGSRVRKNSKILIPVRAGLPLQPDRLTASRTVPTPTGGCRSRPGWHNHDVADDRDVADNPPPDFSVKPVLTGDRVVLRPFRADDIPALLEALADPEVLRLTGSVHDSVPDAETVLGPDEADSLGRYYATRNEQPDRLDLAVIDQARGRCVGEVVLNQWDEGNRSCNFRTLIGPAGRDRGLGTEALRLIAGYGFEQLGLHRISLEVYAFNPRARHVYEKVGFIAEGVLRDALRYEEGWVDATVMSILDHEWARHRGHPPIPG